MTMEAWKGIKYHIEKLLDAGILKECQPLWNIPFLLVQKSGTNEYRPVQVLQAVNNAVTTFTLYL